MAAFAAFLITVALHRLADGAAESVADVLGVCATPQDLESSGQFNNQGQAIVKVIRGDIRRHSDLQNSFTLSSHPFA